MILANHNQYDSYKYYIVASILCAMFSIMGEHINVGMIKYIVVFIFLGISLLVTIPKRNYKTPGRYGVIFFLYLVTMIINAVVSPYTTGIKHIAIGASITILPFLIFITSYNFILAKKAIERVIDYWIYFIIAICCIAFVETFILQSDIYYSAAILKTKVIKLGFFASLCNQGVILSLYRYSSTQLSKYKKIAILLSVSSILTIQIKVVVGLVIIWALYIHYIKQRSNFYFLFTIIFLTFIGYIAIMNIPALNEKIDKYSVIYGASDSHEMIARPALYYQSLNIANDFFPLGSGQGTFGSIPVNMVYNKVYYDYGLSNIHGLGESGENYKMDTHWASILGENGYLGTLFYIMLFFYPISRLKYARHRQQYNMLKFLFISIFLDISIESITLCLPNTMAFMFIYAGILGLICRQITLNKW